MAGSSKAPRAVQDDGPRYAMTIHSLVHLRAWVLEEIESLLTAQSEATLAWAADLLLALWSDIQLAKPRGKQSRFFRQPASDTFSLLLFATTQES